MTRSMSRLSALALSCTLTVGATAGLVSTQTIGSGAKSASLQFDFENGNTHVVNLRWDGTLTGFGALEIMSTQATGGRLDFLSFTFGKFVTGLGVGGDYQYGEGELWPIENYWHYWTEVNGQWEMAMFGASDRLLVDGSKDAWVFGSGAVPQAVPAPGAAAVALLAFARSRRRR